MFQAYSENTQTKDFEIIVSAIYCPPIIAGDYKFKHIH